jgi:hypothetical protein
MFGLGNQACLKGPLASHVRCARQSQEDPTGAVRGTPCRLQPRQALLSRTARYQPEI